MKRPPLTALEAKCCCECAHWHRKDATFGECREPGKFWGVEYENPETGESNMVEWWTTGMYATCRDWQAKLAAVESGE